MNTSLQSLGTLQARQQHQSHRLCGRFTGSWATDRGAWIRQSRHGWKGCADVSWYFTWKDNPWLSRHMLSESSVEFTLTTDHRGRPIAINVTLEKQTQRLSGALATGSGASAAGEMQPSR